MNKMDSVGGTDHIAERCEFAMKLLVGLEDDADNRPLAWALEYPGCFASGNDPSEAVIRMAPSFLAYKAWIGSHTRENWLEGIQAVDVSLAEVWQVYRIDPDYNTSPAGDYEVNAWFRHDWKPLTRIDVRRGLQLLSFARADLLETVHGLTDDILDRTYPNERWSIRGVLRHIANAEWWYLDRLGQAAGVRGNLPEDIFLRLEAVRTQLIKTLPEWEGVEKVTGVQGEIWSPRKVLRRSIWHELDHIEHIKKLSAMV